MFSDRLSQFIQAIGETPTSLETLIGVSKGAIYKPVRFGKTIGVEILKKIADRYPHLDLEWLITGNGNMLKDNLRTPGNLFAEDQEDYHSKVLVRLIHEKKALGWDGHGAKADQVTEATFYLPAAMLKPGPTYAAFRVKDAAMELSVPPRTVVIAVQVPPETYGRVQGLAIVITDCSLVLRHLTSHPEKKCFQLKADQPGIAIQELPFHEITSLWQVKSVYIPNVDSVTTQHYHRLHALEARILSLEKKHHE